MHYASKVYCKLLSAARNVSSARDICDGKALWKHLLTQILSLLCSRVVAIKDDRGRGKSGGETLLFAIYSGFTYKYKYIASQIAQSFSTLLPLLDLLLVLAAAPALVLAGSRT